MWIVLYTGYYSIINEKWMLCIGSKNILSLSDMQGPSQHMSFDMRAIEKIFPGNIVKQCSQTIEVRGKNCKI